MLKLKVWTGHRNLKLQLLVMFEPREVDAGQGQEAETS